MNALGKLFESKTWWSVIFAIIWEVLKAQFGFGVTPGAGLIAPAAMSLRTWGKETGGK